MQGLQVYYSQTSVLLHLSSYASAERRVGKFPCDTSDHVRFENELAYARIRTNSDNQLEEIPA